MNCESYNWVAFSWVLWEVEGRRYLGDTTPDLSAFSMNISDIIPSYEGFQSSALPPHLP